MIDRRNLVCVLGIALSIASPARAKVELARIFGPEMVLQRGSPLPIWGTATPSQEVTVSLGGQTQTATADDGGGWLVRLDPRKYVRRPETLTVKCSDNTIELANVRFGEVWLVLTNRRTLMYRTGCPPQRAANRITDIGGRGRFSPTPVRAFGQNRPWGGGAQRGSRFDVFSCQFANQLAERAGGPVGIITAHVDNIQAATPAQGFALTPELKDIAARVERWDPTTKRGAEAHAQWLARTRKWAATMRRDLDSGAAVKPSQPPLLPGPTPGDPTEPTVVFNEVINPIVPMACRGVIVAITHNTNHSVPDPSATDPRYTAKLIALIRGLRAVFARPELAVCVVQQSHPNLYYLDTLATTLDVGAWGALRDRQWRAVFEPHTGVVVTADIAAHPVDTARRTARRALKELRGGWQASGPIYKGLSTVGDKAVVTFYHAGSGLMAGAKLLGRPPVEQKDGRIKFLAVAGADRIWRRAEGHIIRSAGSGQVADTLIVRSAKVARPVAVRYALEIAPRGMNLYNRGGLPASPFRTDDWPIGGFEKLYEAYRSKPAAELVSRLGYPADLSAHAAAKALAGLGENKALPIARKLLADKDPDLRCGALRTLGYLYWMGPVELRGGKYSRVAPQVLTEASSDAVRRICDASGDRDFLVRRAAAEALGLIGGENELIFRTLKALAADAEPLVRCAALKVTKFRLKNAAYNVAIANAALAVPRPGDHATAEWAALLLSRYCRSTKVDVSVITDYMKRQDIGTCGPALNNIGVMVFRGKVITRGEALFVPAALHLYGLGCREWGLHGMEQRILAKKEFAPAVEAKIAQLKAELVRLKRAEPPGKREWTLPYAHRERSRRYEHAIEGLQKLLSRAAAGDRTRR